MPLISAGEYQQSDNKDDDNGDECDLGHRSSMCLVRNSPMLMATSPNRIRVISSAVSIVQIYNIILTYAKRGGQILKIIRPPFQQSAW